jgi:membrane protease YdiL (CAAX protease family)
VASQTLGAIVFLAWRGALAGGVPVQVDNLESNGPMLATAFLVSTPLVLAYFALAVRLARAPFAEYMALNWPRWRDILTGVGALVAVLIVAGVGATLSGQETPDFRSETLRTARDAGLLPLFFFSFAVLAPLQEELFFRGFLYRGLGPAIGPWPTIILTSAVWAVVHLQYDWFFVGEIFMLGVVFGWLRMRSGSTILTMLLRRHEPAGGAARGSHGHLTPASVIAGESVHADQDPEYLHHESGQVPVPRERKDDQNRADEIGPGETRIVGREPPRLCGEVGNDDDHRADEARYVMDCERRHQSASRVAQ